MIVETIPIFSDNFAYLVICETSGRAAAVDPADPGPVLARVRARGATLTAVWSTHHHPDHTAGNEALAREVAGLKIYGHASDQGRLPGLTDPLEHGAEVPLGRLRARVLHTPGHTRGGIAYHVEGAVFTGDALFGAGCGRLFEGDPPTLYRSLNEILGALPGETRVYFGHEYTEKNLAFALTLEPEREETRAREAAVRAMRARGEPSTPSTLEEERRTNPFLRCHDPSLAAGVAARDGGPVPRDPMEVFARVRALRDRF